MLAAPGSSGWRGADRARPVGSRFTPITAFSEWCPRPGDLIAALEFLGSVNRHHRSGDQMSAEQPKTLSERRADYVRQLHDLETRKNGTITISSDEHPPTAEDRVRQIERMKNAIAQMDEALVR